MPVNLNALIRYKTMDQCFATGRRYTLKELAERCSEALSEKSGSTRSVSTRTIQDDIRVMRSELLAFNAPIEVKDGLYYYAEPGEYVFRKKIEDREILARIMKVLIEVQKQIRHKRLYFVILEISDIMERKILPEMMEEIMYDKSWDEIRFKYAERPHPRTTCKEETVPYEPEKDVFCWEKVFRVL